MNDKRTIRVKVDAIKAPADVAVCRISGDPPGVHGGVIFIPANEHCQLTFELDAGNTGLTFANNPFSSKVDECPEAGESADGLNFRERVADSFTVDVEPVPNGRSVIHYALHFNKRGGGRADCDPVIIRD